MPDTIDSSLPELQGWMAGLLLGSVCLMVVAVVLFFRDRSHPRKPPWFAVMCFLAFGVGCWSLVVALLAFQQLLGLQHTLPHSLTAAVVRTLLDADRRTLLECQGHSLLTLVGLVTMLVLWWRLRVRRRSGNESPPVL